MVTPLFGIIAISLSLFFATNENRALASPPSPKPYVVVLDPGHGGADTGASGRLGKTRIAEKEVALAIALKAAKILGNPAYYKPLGRKIQVVLTRHSDRSVSLEERSEKAKRLKADLFVSIHANSEPTKKAHGLETYFLNNTDDQSSLKLQQIENRSSKRARKSNSLLIRSVAADATVESSRSAAEVLQSSIVDQLRSEDLKVQDRGVKQAMLYVLLDAQVPAALVEGFYLSNKNDLALVAQPENRSKIAEGLAKGVLRFLATK
ncbi:MAG TPA: N-acetylmuramoyl-L-alanine amidase [Bdellovibrionota bacterium]|jgi:N-acetylmuramoyl-L-alanine amidase